MISRRSFLGGALALTAFTVLPAEAFADVPTIHGDGVHDDAPGLNALFAGEPFRVAGSGPMALYSRDGTAVIDGGEYRLTGPLRLTAHSRILSISNATFYAEADGLVFDGGYSTIGMTNCRVDVSRAQTAWVQESDELWSMQIAPVFAPA